MIYSRLGRETIYSVILAVGALLALFSYWVADGLARTVHLLRVDQMGAMFPYIATLTLLLFGLAVIGLALPLVMAGYVRRGRIPRRQLQNFCTIAAVVLVAELAASQILTHCLDWVLIQRL